MLKFLRKTSHTAGLPPGTLVHIGEKKVEKVKISVINYNQEKFEEKIVNSIDECLSFIDSSSVTWINIQGIHDEKIIDQIGKSFEISHLSLEDVMNTSQRPKVEDFSNYIFFVLRTVFYEETSKEMNFENVSIILGNHFVISFQERENSLFNPIRDRIRNSAGRIRKSGNDFLAYSLIDTIVDNFFPTLEKLGEKIETIEDNLISEPTQEDMQELHKLRREIIIFLKSIQPVREILNHIQREEPEIFADSTFLYFRDIYDHVIHLIETLDIYRDLITGMVEMYLSKINNKMNEVMKVLTIIATIFIPLTFITGIYGMNFNYMPELEAQNGYYIVILIMTATALSMLVLFKKKHWI